MGKVDLGGRRAASRHLLALHDILPPPVGLLSAVADAGVAFLERVPLSGGDAESERDRRVRNALQASLQDVTEGPPVHGSRETHAARLLDI